MMNCDVPDKNRPALDQMFANLLQEAGIVFNPDGTSFRLLSGDLGSTRRMLISLLTKPEIDCIPFEDFTKGLVELVEGEDGLRILLKPFEGSSSSLASLLLGIALVQPQMLKLLMENVVEYLDEIGDLGSKSVPKMVLDHLRHVESIADPESFTSLLTEALDVTDSHPEFLIDLIAIVPEIIADSQQRSISSYLLKLMNSNNRYTAPILDALTCLTLDEKSLHTAQAAAMENLASSLTPLEALPCLITFILQFATTETITQLLQSLRLALKFDAVAEQMRSVAIHSNQGKGKKAMDTNCMSEDLILDSFKNSFRIHPFIADAWIKVLAVNTDDENVLLVLDFLILAIIFHMLPNCRKKVLGIISSKANVEAIAKQCIDSHYVGIRPYFNSTYLMAEQLIDGSIKRDKISIEIYSGLFAKGDAYDRQEIIGSLVTCIGSRVESQVNFGLKALLMFARDFPNQLDHFIIFIKSILDYIESLNLFQTRIFFEILSGLCVHNWSELEQQEETTNVSEYCMLIHKYLSCSDSAFQSAGVIGAISIIAQLASVKYGGNVIFLKTAQDLFLAIHRNCSTCLQMISFAYDELAFHISRQHIQQFFLKFIFEYLNSSFMEEFVMRNNSSELSLLSTYQERQEEAHNILCPLEKWISIDNSENHIATDISISLYPSVVKGFSEALKLQFYSDSGINRQSVILLSAQANILLSCYHASDELMNANNIYRSMIYWGLYMYAEDSDLSLLSNEGKLIVCTTLFFAINWTIQMLNNFASYPNETIFCFQKVKFLIKLLKRFDEMKGTLSGWSSEDPFKVDLKNINEPKHLVKSFSFIGTQYVNDCDESQPSIATEQISKTTIKRPKSKPSKIVKDKAANIGTDGFREINMSVMNLFSAVNAGETANMLDYDEWEWILSVLLQKIKFKFFDKTETTRTSLIINNRHISRSSDSEVLDILIKIVPGVLSLLDRICDSIQDHQDSFGAYDLTGTTELPLARCFLYILEFFTMMFSLKDSEIEFNQIMEAITKSKASDDTPQQKKSLSSQTLEKFLPLELFIFSYESAFWFTSTLIAIDKVDSIDRREIFNVLNRFVSGSNFTDHPKPHHLEFLLESFISYSDEPIKMMDNIVDEAFPAFRAKDAEVLLRYPMLNRDTFLIYFKVVFSEIAGRTAGLNASIGSTNKSNSKRRNGQTLMMSKEQLELLTGISRIFSELMSMVKFYDAVDVVLVVFKYAKLFMTNLIKYFPQLTACFKEYHVEVNLIFRLVQQGTRILQTLCNEYKIRKDQRIKTTIPVIRKTLETFIVGVKKMLTDNSLSEAFWVGNLKIRDLAGREVSSQIVLRECDENTDVETDEEVVERTVDVPTKKINGKSGKSKLNNQGDLKENAAKAKRTKKDASKKKRKRSSLESIAKLQAPQNETFVDSSSENSAEQLPIQTNTLIDADDSSGSEIIEGDMIYRKSQIAVQRKYSSNPESSLSDEEPLQSYKQNKKRSSRSKESLSGLFSSSNEEDYNSLIVQCRRSNSKINPPMNAKLSSDDEVDIDENMKTSKPMVLKRKPPVMASEENVSDDLDELDSDCENVPLIETENVATGDERHTISPDIDDNLPNTGIMSQKNSNQNRFVALKQSNRNDSFNEELNDLFGSQSQMASSQAAKAPFKKKPRLGAGRPPQKLSNYHSSVTSTSEMNAILPSQSLAPSKPKKSKVSQKKSSVCSSNQKRVPKSFVESDVERSDPSSSCEEGEGEWGKDTLDGFIEYD